MKKNKLKDKLTNVVTSIAFGMKGADEVMFNQSGSDNNIVITAQKEESGTLAQALRQGEVTQEVMELRDRTYMVEEESENYEVIGVGDEDGEAFSITPEFKKPKVDEIEEDYEVIIVQNTEGITSGIKEAMDRINEFGIPIQYPLTIERGFTSRFPIEKNCHQLVIKKHKTEENLYQLEFYCTKYPDPIDRIARMFTNEAEKLYKNSMYRSDIKDFDSVYFVSSINGGNKPWGVKNNREFKYSDIKYKYSNEFDGYYVFKFESKCIINGKSILDKFYNKEIRTKYDNKEKRPGSDKPLMLFGDQIENKPYYCDVCGKEMVGLEKQDWSITKETYRKGMCQECLSNYLYKIKK